LLKEQVAGMKGILVDLSRQLNGMTEENSQRQRVSALQLIRKNSAVLKAPLTPRGHSSTPSATD